MSKDMNPNKIGSKSAQTQQNQDDLIDSRSKISRIILLKPSINICDDLKMLHFRKSRPKFLSHVAIQPSDFKKKNTKQGKFGIEKVGIFRCTIDLGQLAQYNGISRPFSLLKRMKTLSKLSIIIEDSELRNNHHFEAFLKGLTKIVSLSKLSLVLINGEFHGKKTQNIYFCLRKLHSLKSLALVSEHQTVSNIASNYFKRLNHLQEIHFELFTLKSLANQQDLFLLNLSSCLKELKSLSKIVLVFSKLTRMNGLKNLFQGLEEYNQNLQSLSFCFDHCLNIPEEEEDFFSVLGRLKKLKELNFYFRLTQTPSPTLTRSFHQLCENIRDWSNLRSLKLNFPEKMAFEDSIFQDLAIVLHNNRRHLLNLHLHLDDCSKATEASLENIGKCFESLENLQYLALELKSIFSSSKHGIQMIFQSLKNLKKLVSLHLDFSKTDSITDFELKMMATSLSSLKSLNEIELNFSFCTKITDESLNELALRFEEMNFLSRISINFNGCLHLTSQGVKDFLWILKTLKMLASLRMVFFNCPLIKRFEKRNIPDSLKNRVLFNFIKF